jgi:ribonuclease HII
MEGGIDEAGRGPVLGPLVVAGVAVPDPAVLATLGCRDSKQLTPAKRVRLARLIRDLPGVRVEVRVVAPEELDRQRADRTLNDVEVVLFQSIAQALACPRIVVDAADVDAARFGARVAAVLPDGTDVVSEHRADDHHVTVAAASIIAKTVRDEAIAELGRRLERRLTMPLGSGYPSDPKTRAFLAAWVARFGDLPEGTRRSWATAKDLLGPRETTLGEFA